MLVKELLNEAFNSTVDKHAADELHLYANNHEGLHHQRMEPIRKNLQKKHDKGVYDHEKSKKLWRYAADDAAKRYEKEHGGKFNTATRQHVADRMADDERDEHGWGK